MEVHENPERALSDGPNAYRLGRLRGAAPAPAAGAARRPPSRAADVGGEKAGRRLLVFAPPRRRLRRRSRLRAWLAPPRGTVFVGTFYYVDDFYNYLSYVEQAERGALVFGNKLAVHDAAARARQPRVARGRVAVRAARGAPLVAYRLFGLLALAALVLGIERWLTRSGLPADRRLAGLLLVCTGGGLGGLLLALGRLPGERALDVRTGAFPFVETIANPHFVAGTALLLAALGAYAAGRRATAAALGTVLGLVRPYDAALLAGIEGLAVLLTTPARAWPRRLLPVAALLPVLAYNAWLFLASPGFSAFSSPRYASLAPPPADLAMALGPAALLAVTAVRWRGGDGAGHRLRLALWATLAFLVVLLRPVSFSLQLVVGIGVPLLVLGAVGLARLPRGVLEAAVPLMASTAAVVVWLCAIPGNRAATPRPSGGGWPRRLRAVCRPGETVLAPPEVGLYVGGLTACWPFVSHAAAPDHDARAEAVQRFYTQSTPEERASLLEGHCVSHLVLPPRAPDGWLGPRAPYRPRLELPGAQRRHRRLEPRRRRGLRRPPALRAPPPSSTRPSSSTAAGEIAREPEERGRDVDDAGRPGPRAHRAARTGRLGQE